MADTENQGLKVPIDQWKVLSHRERRCHVNKERRRHRRITLAQQREAARKALEARPGYLEGVFEEERRLEEEQRREEVRRLLNNAAWKEREMLAQQEFRNKRELEMQRKREKEAREQMIREEWENLQKKEKEENDARDREKKEKEEKLREALSVGHQERTLTSITSSEPWHNPIVPADFDGGGNLETADTLSSRDYGTEKDKQFCSFYLKTGACRYGDRCSRQHPHLGKSRTLMIPSMYSSLAIREQMLNEKNQDAELEHDDQEAYEDFKRFFNDVLGEFSKAGQVVQLKVACNYEIHLRGNVYVQYLTEEECANAYQMFNGRWYAQKQLSCRLCPITKWKTAICGMYNQNRCPKGRNCNFLHVFKNPGGAFSRADKDLPPFSPAHQSTPSYSSRRSSRDSSPKSSYRHRRRSSGDRWRDSSESKGQGWEHYYSRNSRSRYSGSRKEHRSRSRSGNRKSRFSRSRSRNRTRRNRTRSGSRSGNRTRRSRSGNRARSRSGSRKRLRCNGRRSISPASCSSNSRTSSSEMSGKDSDGERKKHLSSGSERERRKRKKKEKKKKKSGKNKKLKKRSHHHHRHHHHHHHDNKATYGSSVIRTLDADQDKLKLDQNGAENDTSNRDKPASDQDMEKPDSLEDMDGANGPIVQDKCMQINGSFDTNCSFPAIQDSKVTYSVDTASILRKV